MNEEYYRARLDRAFEQAGLPHYMKDGIVEYVMRGRPPGGFLTAVLCNELVDACCRADSVNLLHIREWALFVYNDIPSQCWRNATKMDAWMQDGGLAGKMSPNGGSDSDG